MHTAPKNSHGYRTVALVVIAGLFATSAPAAETMPPAQQNTLVQTYCAVCHTDAAKNGGLSLEHYDAAQANPALAAMLLSKLRNSAMGAAGLGVPDSATRNAWVAATAAQAERAKDWAVVRHLGWRSAAVTVCATPERLVDQIVARTWRGIVAPHAAPPVSWSFRCRLPPVRCQC